MKGYLFYYRLFPRVLPNPVILGKYDHCDGNENGKKSTGLDWLCTCITPFCTFLSRRSTTTTWKYQISRFVEDGNTKQQFSFSFPELWYNPLEFNSKKFANIWRIKRDGMSAIKFEAARIHFLRDLFVAVAVAWARKGVCGKNSDSRWSLAQDFAIMIIWKRNLCIGAKLTAPLPVCNASSEQQELAKKYEGKLVIWWDSVVVYTFSSIMLNKAPAPGLSRSLPLL